MHALNNVRNHSHPSYEYKRSKQAARQLVEVGVVGLRCAVERLAKLLAAIGRAHRQNNYEQSHRNTFRSTFRMGLIRLVQARSGDATGFEPERLQ